MLISKRTSIVFIGLIILLGACQGTGGGSEPYLAEGFEVPFPLGMPSQDQLDEARACASQVEALSEELFSESMTAETMEGMEVPSDDCERAAMALATSDRAGDGQLIQDIDSRPWVAMVESNPAMALMEPIFYDYLGGPNVISPPPWAGDSLEMVAIRYSWDGMGDSIDYELTFSPVEGGYAAEGQVNGAPFTATVEAALVDGLTDGLSGLVPVQQAAKLIVCMDNYPSFQLELTYSDGRVVDLNTTESNIFYFGGPWFAIIDEQVYLQVTGAMVEKVNNLVNDLQLPFGQAQGMYCADMDVSILDKLFPDNAGGE